MPRFRAACCGGTNVRVFTFSSRFCVLRAQGEKVVLVDVRSREEAEVSTLPGALWRVRRSNQALSAAFSTGGRRVISPCSSHAPRRRQEEFERDAARYDGWKVVSFCTIGARSGARAGGAQHVQTSYIPASALARKDRLRADGSVRFHQGRTRKNCGRRGWMRITSGAGARCVLSSQFWCSLCSAVGQGRASLRHSWCSNMGRQTRVPSFFRSVLAWTHRGLPLVCRPIGGKAAGDRPQARLLLQPAAQPSPALCSALHAH